MTATTLRLRPAGPEDCRWVWETATDPVVRQASFSTEPIPWEAHRAWFAARLADPHCLFLIGTDESGMPLGQARYSFDGATATISVCLGAPSRGRGLGAALIRQACDEVFRAGRADVIHALIRRENEPSRRAFRAAGFVHDQAVEVHGQPGDRFLLHR